jgi:hypothetical protein
VRPAPELEVNLTDEQYRLLHEQRRARDVLTVAPDGAAPAAEPAAQVPDPQLERAVAYLQQRLG